MTNTIEQEKRHKRLQGESLVQQIFTLMGMELENPEVIAKLNDDDLGGKIFMAVAKIFRDWIEAGLEMERDRWNNWNQYEGGQQLQKWWIHCKTDVEDLRIAKLAKLIHDTLSGNGKIERMILSELSYEEQDVILRRITRSEARKNGTGPI